MVNAGISGDTTAGGRSRLPALLRQHQPSVVIIELGGNDALRGMPLSTTQANLVAMARASRRAAGAEVLLVGMEMPPNYGARYTQEFRELFKNGGRQRKHRRWCLSCWPAWPTGPMRSPCSRATASTPTKARNPSWPTTSGPPCKNCCAKADPTRSHD